MIAPNFGHATGARKEWRLVHRSVKNVRIIPKNVLGTVPVVHIPIDDRDTARAPLPRVMCGDSGVVEEAKTHGAIARRVMTGRANKRHAEVRFTCK